MLPGDFATVASCGDPTNGSIVIDDATGCATYTAPATEGITDTFCLVVCDDLGFCDTTITVIEVPETIPDTVLVILPPDSMTVVCADTTMLPGDYATIESCGDPVNGSIELDDATGCATYTGGGVEGITDTFCLVVCDDLGFCDTTITIIEVPQTTPDTVFVLLPPDSMTVVCADTTMLPGDYATIESCGDPENGSIELDGVTGCATYTAPPTEGVADTFCLIVCDDLGFCDTTITVIEVPETTPDTVLVVLPPDSTTTVCADTTMLPGDYATLESCGDPANGSIVLDDATGCATYTGGGVEGITDTFCLVVCDDLGFCDTTITIIEVPETENDTLMILLPPDSMTVVCADTSMLPGDFATVASCGDPVVGSIVIDDATGCATYTGGGVEGITDTFCLVVCDDLGFCDTTITIIEVPETTPTLSLPSCPRTVPRLPAPIQLCYPVTLPP